MHVSDEPNSISSWRAHLEQPRTEEGEEKMKSMRDNVHTAAGATTVIAVCALIGCVVLASSGAVFHYFFCLLPLYFVLPRGFLGQGRPASHPTCPPGITQKHKVIELQDPSHL